MGWFSSEYVTTVGTVVSRVIEDDMIPGAVKTGSIKSLFREGNLPDYVMEELVSSLGVRAERMYKYGGEKYDYGLPSGEVYSSTQGREQVEAVIEAAEGQQVLLDYSYFGPRNALHIGWMKLVSQHGYDTATNKLENLSAQKGAPVYLTNMVVEFPSSLEGTIEQSVLEQWGPSPKAGYNPFNEISEDGLTNMYTGQTAGPTPAATELQVKVSYAWVSPGASRWFAIVNTGSFVISLSDYSSESDYFQARYTVNNRPKYFLYEFGSGGQPTLDAVFTSSPSVNGSYFPFTYFRYGKQSMNANKNSSGYKTSKRMVKYLGMDYDLLADTINENPDIADVEQAMMIFAVPPLSSNPIECRYLFEYFDAMHFALGAAISEEEEGDGFTGLSFFGRNRSKNSTIIQDSLFKMALGNDGISKRMVAGSIGSVGTYTSAFENDYHIYRNQVATGLYEEIRVLDLKMTYYVYGNYTTTGDDTGPILLVPIDKTISGQFSIAERETLYARSLHFVFNSRVVTKVKWYQTGIFKVLLIIIAIVITIYTYGADGGSAIATALGLSGAAGLIATIVVNLVLGQVLAAGFTLFVKLVGPEVAAAFAVLAVIYGGYQIIQAGSVAGAPWAPALLQISSGIQSAVIKAKFQDLLEQADELKLFIEEQTKSLETSQELLENSKILDPFVVFGEAPQDFYNRTVHSGNIGLLGINAISSYVDIALTLPKLNDTVGEEIYG